MMAQPAMTIDQKDFAELYDEYADYALRCAVAITQNRAAAADAVQEAFLRVYRHWDAYDPHRPFKPWLYRILVNECKRSLKGGSKTISIEEYRERGAHPSADDWYSFQEYEELYDSIQGLHDQYRVPIVLRYLNAFSEKEIAEILDLNLNTVKSRLLKGRRKLRSSLEMMAERRSGDG